MMKWDPIKKTPLPPDLVERGTVYKSLLLHREAEVGIYEVAVLELSPGAKIRSHPHKNDNEMYVRMDNMSVSICTVGQSHWLENNTADVLYVISVKWR